MCNPLLDISADVPMDLLEKYNVKLNNAILGESYRLLSSSPKLQY